VEPKYTAETDKRILAVLDRPVLRAMHVGLALSSRHVQYAWRFLRAHKIILSARKSWCESKDPDFAAKATAHILLSFSIFLTSLRGSDSRQRRFHVRSRLWPS
jgi:hypothetical protein